jgi:hypothetical protein
VAGTVNAKLEPHRAFLLEKVAEKADITMPELAAELAAATCQKADPASLSRWPSRVPKLLRRRRLRIHLHVRRSSGGRSAANRYGLSKMPFGKQEQDSKSGRSPKAPGR